MTFFYEKLRTRICCLWPPPFQGTKMHILKPRETFVLINASSYSSCLLAPSFDLLSHCLLFHTLEQAGSVTPLFSSGTSPDTVQVKAEDSYASPFLFSGNCQCVFAHRSYPNIPGAHPMSWSAPNRGSQQSADCTAVSGSASRSCRSSGNIFRVQ